MLRPLPKFIDVVHGLLGSADDVAARVLRAAAFACSALLSFAASAQSWPAKPVRLILGYTTGGAADSTARPLIAKMEPALGQSFVIEYRPGAGATIAADAAAKAPPDGYTLHLVDAGPMTIAPHLSKVGYDPLASFTPIGLVNVGGSAIVAHPSVPVNSLAELIRLAKSQPGKFSYGTSGVGGAGHLAGELFKSITQTDLVHVAYKGGAPAMTDLMGGQIPLLFSSMATAVPHIKSGRIKGLAVTALQRASAIPDVPTAAEQGLPGYEAVAWFALIGPAGLPAEVVSSASRALNRALEDRGFQEAIRAQGFETASVPSTPAKLASLIRSDFEKWGKVMRDAKIKAE